ncbi:hypothetical protein BDV96DRAFT_645134 [Lophiotrema nucula]|uniref:Uncharacterized protein n=1 Tax=Lophiotrema nucula TaxID=690887 RepID=A0A6A5ZE43_9PLEO|nr:hypothetical protein BDV96DRAFT_645134 [Lophiotrema nucula]
MGLFYELHKHHYSYDGGSKHTETETFHSHTTGASYRSESNTEPLLERFKASAKQTAQKIHGGLVEIGIIFDCFGQEVEEKLKAIAEIWGWSGKRTCHNRYVNVPIAACILILAGAFGLAYAMACGLCFPARSFPAILSAIAIIYIAGIMVACIFVALSTEEVDDTGGHAAGATWWKARDIPGHLKESTPHGDVNHNLIDQADSQ